MATVKTDVMSRPFNLSRGTKQGDPFSSLLFNALLQHILEPLIAEWQNNDKGVQLGFTPTTTLTNLRFADDVLLTSWTLPRLTTMLDDIVRAVKTFYQQLWCDQANSATSPSLIQCHLKVRGAPLGNPRVFGAPPERQAQQRAVPRLRAMHVLVRVPRHWFWFSSRHRSGL